MDLTVEPRNIPRELTDRDQWVNWAIVVRGGKETKVPLRVDGGFAAADAPHTWASFAEVYSAGRANGWGVGFVFSAGDPYCGFDLDEVIVGNGVVEWAAEILELLASYSEVSPSGAGVKVIVRASLPPGRRGWGQGHGMYDRGRFFTVTGRHLWGSPWAIRDRPGEVRALHARLFPATAVARTTTGGPRLPGYLTDEDVLERARKAKNGDKFLRLFGGDIVGYASHSEADAALASLLGFWTQDAEQVARLIAASGLGREKWDRRGHYRETTIARGLDRQQVWTPRVTATASGQTRPTKRPA